MLVPPELQLLIIELMHCAMCYAVYEGIQPTIRYIKLFFEWKGIPFQVAEYCKHCVVCKTTKPLNQKNPRLLTSLKIS